MKTKTLKDLLQYLQTLSPEELSKHIIYSSDNLCLSGIVKGFGKSKSDLYYDGGDDPIQLKTKKEWKQYGYDNEDIKRFEKLIKKGDFVINF